MIKEDYSEQEPIKSPQSDDVYDFESEADIKSQSTPSKRRTPNSKSNATSVSDRDSTDGLSEGKLKSLHKL